MTDLEVAFGQSAMACGVVIMEPLGLVRASPRCIPRKVSQLLGRIGREILHLQG